MVTLNKFKNNANFLLTFFYKGFEFKILQKRNLHWLVFIGAVFQIPKPIKCQVFTSARLWDLPVSTIEYIGSLHIINITLIDNISKNNNGLHYDATT